MGIEQASPPVGFNAFPFNAPRCDINGITTGKKAEKYCEEGKDAVERRNADNDTPLCTIDQEWKEEQRQRTFERYGSEHEYSSGNGENLCMLANFAQMERADVLAARCRRRKE